MMQDLSIAQRIRLLRKAVDVGLLRQEDLGLPQGPTAATLSEEDLRATFDRLLAEGRLSPHWVEEQLPAPPSMGPSAFAHALSWDLPPAAVSEDLWSSFPLPRDGEYAPLAFLGDGGMGRVFKAYDHKLGRVVALKFLKRLEEGPLDRFLMEGRAQAQIDHPNVCDIFSVGEVEGHPYLAMRYIDGPTLKAALPLLNLQQKIRVLKAVAEALHACHRLGIIHRDVKPGNIMLERREDGAWWPFVMDFGLARDLGSEGMTVSGVIVGTPLYCSPEQVQGRMQDVDRRSDVYALGATLYECLCGQAPFPPQGSLVDLIRRISEEEPQPLVSRVPNLPRDLETIVLKALEKDPSRRYDSARAFAEDLGRFLDGDPIQAHGATLSYRIAKRIRKHKALALAVATSAVLLVTLATLVLVRARTLAMSAQRFGREAEQMETMLYKAYNLPLHDVRAERAQVLARLEFLKAELASNGRWSQAAGRLALGRGYLGLDRLDEARAQLELASRAAPQDAEIAYALGFTLARQYQQYVEGLRGRTLEERKQELEGPLRKPALARLRQAREGQAPGSSAEALLALVEERYADALLGTRQVQLLSPWNHEAWLLEADVHKAMAGRSLDRGDTRDAERRLALAGDALLRARTISRSAPLAYESEVQRLMMVYQVHMDRGDVSEEDRDRALEAADLALRADPESWRTLSFVSAIHRRWGKELLDRGQDPTPFLDKAIQAAQQGLAVRPTDNPLWNNLGTALRNLASWETARGEDPSATLARAVDALEAALQRPQFKDWLLNSLGWTHVLWAKVLLTQGRDPSAEVGKAMACFQEASLLKPWVGHNCGEGDTQHLLARYRISRGEDPFPAFTQATQAFEAGLQLNPNSYQAHQGLADTLLDRATALQDSGREGSRELQEARKHLDETLRLNPRLDGLVRIQRAQASALEARRLTDPAKGRQARTQALDLLRQASGSTAGNPDLQTAAAGVCLLLAREGQASALGLRMADQALQARPWDASLHLTRGGLLLASGRRAQGLEALDKAVAMDPNLARAADRARRP